MSRFAPHVSSRPRARTALAALAGLAAATALASPLIATAAQPADRAPQVIVNYSLHDLATEQGTGALYRRIKDAARAVCPGYDSRDLGAIASSRECQRQAVARAIRQIGNRRLAAVHARASGGQG